MEQKKWTLCDITVTKIKKSALIALGGLLVIAVPFVANELIALLQNGDAFDWRSLLVMVITAFSTWFVNTIKEWLKGS
jgi:hypothetical protein